MSLGFEKVSQHNLLVRHPMRMGLYEARIFALMLRCIHQNMDHLPTIKVLVRDVTDCEKPCKKQYQLIEQACDALFRKELNLLDPKVKKSSSFSKVRIVQDLTHIEGTGYIIGTFAEKIRDYLLDLKESIGFTVGEIDQLMRLRNANSHRIYWLLKSWDDKPTIDFPIDQFREIILGKDHIKYSQFGQFNRAILAPAIEELNKIGFPVQCKELKELKGKTVTGLRFTYLKTAQEVTKKVSKVKNQKNEESVVKILNQDAEYLRIRAKMTDKVIGLTPTQADKILGEIYADQKEVITKIWHTLYHLRQHLVDNAGKIHSAGAFSMNRFKEVFKLS